MRDPQVIVVRRNSIERREAVEGAPVWGWSSSDGAAAGEPSVVADAVPGDYIVWHSSWTGNGRRRLLPWSVLRARPLGRGFSRQLASVTIGCGAISRHRTVEAAVKRAAAMLRKDNEARAAAARAACTAGEPVACPDQHTCRHGIED